MDLTNRVFDRELMDEPDADPAELAGALCGLEFINGTLGGYRTSLAGIKALLEPRGGETQPTSLLDVGCGSGDTLEQFHRWATARKRKLLLRGIELSEVTVAMACKRLGAVPVADAEISRRDLFDLDPETDGADIVHASLVLHHFGSDEETVLALRAMGKLARCGVVINDLHRHGFAYGSIRLLTGLLSRNPILQHDAALSVRRGFLRAELLRLAIAAGWDPAHISIRWCWAFRWLIIYRKPRLESPHE